MPTPFSRRSAKRADAEKARTAKGRSVRISTLLVILCSLLFLYAVNQTVQGNIPLKRAIPAAVLLLFIGFFGWGVYHVKGGKARCCLSTSASWC